MLEFEGRVAIVTGAARGIGRAIALRLAKAGADIALADINMGGAKDYDEELTADTVEQEIVNLGRRAISFDGDLGDPATAEALIALTIERLGSIDILVNCAGGAILPPPNGTVAVTSPADAQHVFDANYFSMVNCTRAAVPHLAAKRGGSIVNLSSVGGYRPPTDGALAHYCAAKAAVTSFTRSTAGELGRFGIRANVVAPGAVMTARIKAWAKEREVGTPQQLAETPLGRFAEPDDIAKAVQFFASDLASFVTGECLSVSGGQTMVAN